MTKLTEVQPPRTSAGVSPEGLKSQCEVDRKKRPVDGSDAGPFVVLLDMETRH